MRTYNETMRQPRVPDARYFQEQIMLKRPPEDRHFHEQTIVYLPIQEIAKLPQQGKCNSSQSPTQKIEDSRIKKEGKSRTQKTAVVVQVGTAPASLGLSLAPSCNIM